MKIAKNFFAKSFIFDVWMGSEYIFCRLTNGTIFQPPYKEWKMNLLTSILIEKAVGKSTFGCCIKVAKILLFLLMLCCQMLVFKSTERFKKLQIQFIF